MDRRQFIAALSLLAANLARAQGDKPANRNIKWALSEALWRYYPPAPFIDMLAVMQETGFIGVRLAGFPHILSDYQMTATQMLREVSKRNLHVVTISWNGALHDPSQRLVVLESARNAMKFLADFGANHLVVFSPSRNLPETQSPAAFRELCERCNQIGELAGEMGFTAGLHNHMGQMVQNQDEVDRFMAMTDPKLFGLSPDTCHLNLAGCDVVGTLDKYKRRIRFLDYKDSKWTTPTKDWVQPNGKVYSKDSETARFFNSSYDLGDAQVDFPACHRVLKSIDFRGWICVDLDTARLGPLADFHRCGAYIVNKLEPIYA
ncbi:MAG TPA: sugar phosphate isomerase/epimerase family protein [Terracidiphilus sp.]|nr:sugar phosphate isomerase/epimerase family protein [Terracidiphilus sp.]